MKKYIILGVVLTIISTVFLTGCGETLNGMSKDIKRISKGVKMVFIREE